MSIVNKKQFLLIWKWDLEKCLDLYKKQLHRLEWQNGTDISGKWPKKIQTNRMEVVLNMVTL